jgi:protein SCO1/2
VTMCPRIAGVIVLWVALNAAAQAGDAIPAAQHRLAVWPQSLPSPDFTLLDDQARRRSIHDFRGRILLLFFGFVRCPDVCPSELFKLALVMKKLGPVSKHVQVLFVTLDPQHDTAAELKRYLARFDPRFKGLTGTVGQIDETAQRFYVNYARISGASGDGIDHSTSTFVFDASGALRLIGAPSSSVDDFVHDLNALSNTPVAVQ